MRIICTKENFKLGLLATTKIISSNNSLPILNNLLLKTEDGLLKIISTNLEMGITANVRCKIEEAGEITVLAKTLNDLIQNFPDDNIEFYTKDSVVFVKTENQEFSLKTLPSEEFPLIPQSAGGLSYDIDGNVLKESLSKVMFSCSLNQTQPEITGVCVSIKNNKCKIVATDRYRLGERTFDIKGDVAQVIVPHKTAQEVHRLLGLVGGGVRMQVSENQIFFSLSDIEVVSRLIDGVFPDYENIIPEKYEVNITVDKDGFQNALKTNSLFSQGSNSVKFSYTPNALIVSSVSESLGSGVVKVPAVVEGGEGELLMNFKYVLDFLGTLPACKISIKIVNSASPVVFVSDSDAGYLYLVMPIKN